ncbi:SMI1/KNR4 family protein [Ornithobacterium rhinotracheale]|uniref:SMI1/KNR4 family protein n=1 Tax=Ornithobacterium rhinotracheale TaxID=28251 RepID=UPI001FF1166A|nr:SMI1/KNR4 family protein [Ornithobacterium rhinotracheale]MCK0203182.1 SMI1/KNR4 family protein [Ornithobacterium rhinotracheale]
MINSREIWEHILKELGTISPKIYNSFNKGANEQEIVYLESALKTTLPDDFKSYLSVCNGQKCKDYEHPFLGYNCLLSIDEMISTWQMMNDLFAEEEPIEHIKENKIKPVYWNQLWIPFSDYEASSRLILDLDPGVNGNYGQVYTLYSGLDSESDEAVVAQSFKEFSTKVLQTLKNREFSLEDDILEVSWLA